MFKLLKKKINIFKLKKQKVLVNTSSEFNKKTIFEGSNSIGAYSNVNQSYIGFGTYLGDYCSLKNVKIGRYCSIGNRVEVLLNNHPSSTFVSTHPAFHLPSHKLMKKMGLSFAKEDLVIQQKILSEDKHVYIGSDVWLGTDVKILSGVTISDGAIIGAGSIVTKDIPPYSIAVGVPAKVIKMRFEEQDIAMLLNLKWWDKPLKELETLYCDFSDVKNLR